MNSGIKLTAWARLLCLAWFLPAVFAAQDEGPFTRLFDTGTAADRALAEGSLAQRGGWHGLEEDRTNHVFTGDAVILNDKLLVVVRQKGAGAEVYAKNAKGVRQRTIVRPPGTSGATCGLSAALRIVENGSGAVTVEAVYSTREPAGLRFRLTTGEAILEVRSSGGALPVKVLTAAEHVVVPDYFGDDLVFDPIHLRPLYLPAENFCLYLLRESIMMMVWPPPEQDVWLDATGPAEEEPFQCSSRIHCTADKGIWLAFLESPGIWRSSNLREIGGWRPPFPAKWRCSLVSRYPLAESWDLERGPAPGQISNQGQGRLLVYPIDRSEATPLPVTCPTDIMRNTLGVGPCQYILALEGLAAEGDPTPNNVMNWVEGQFEKRKEKKVADDLKLRLDQMTVHVGHARTRLGRYAQAARELRRQLNTQTRAEPLLTIVADLDRFAAAGLVPAASAPEAAKLAAEVRGLIGQANAVSECQRLGQQIRALGAVQDGALARCRMAVRRLHQMARSIAVTQPAQERLAALVQSQTEPLLRQKRTAPGSGDPQQRKYGP